MSAYTDFVELVRSYRAENPAQRDGQAHFNALCDVRPDIANEVIGGPANPFYVDDRLPAFHAFVAERMGRRRVVRQPVGGCGRRPVLRRAVGVVLPDDTVLVVPR